MDIDVVFAVDRNFLPYCAVAMVSALRNKGAAALSFHVVGDDLEETDKRLLRQTVDGSGCSLQFYTVPEEKMRGYEVKWGKERLSRNVFYRCLLASVLLIIGENVA